MQTAYQVLAASAAERLAAGEGDLWDTGKVESDRSIQVEYAGKPLGSGARAWWKVRIWDRDGKASAWSAPAWWETGLMKAEDWKARWISFPQDPPQDPRPSLDGAKWIWFPEGEPAKGAPSGDRFFRRRVDLLPDRKPVSAWLAVAADDAFELYVNGLPAARGSDVSAPLTQARLDDREPLGVLLNLAIESSVGLPELPPSDRFAPDVVLRASKRQPPLPAGEPIHRWDLPDGGLVAKAMGRDVLITIHSHIRPASGLGSSAAPAAGTAVAINELFSLGYTREELVPIAAKGEVASAGVAHADNVGPCIMGGLTIVCGSRAESVEMPDVSIVAILPDIKVSTKAARELLPACVPVKEMVLNVGKACMLVAGAAAKDPYMIGRSLSGSFNEKYRSPLIKGYQDVKAGAMGQGAYGVAISGSGPSMIALGPKHKAIDIEKAMKEAFAAHGVACESYVTRVGRGVEII
jgi:homoserine kinase